MPLYHILAFAEQSPTPVLFVRRTHYLAHPRHNGNIVRRLENEDEVFAAVKQHAQQGSSGMLLVNGDFARMSLREQVRHFHVSLLFFFRVAPPWDPVDSRCR
jgi:hypothetical protein